MDYQTCFYILLGIFAICILICLYKKFCGKNNQGFELKDFIKKSIYSIEGAIDEVWEEKEINYHIRGDEFRAKTNDENAAGYGDIGFDLVVSVKNNDKINVVSNNFLGFSFNKSKENVNKMKFTLTSQDSAQKYNKRNLNKS